MLRIQIVLLALLGVLVGALPASAGALEDLRAEATQRRAVFLLLTDASVEDLTQARAVAKAAQARVPGSSVRELDRSDPAQRDVVTSFRLTAAPVPLILVVAPNGLPVGAARPARTGAVKRLVGLVPTVAKAEYMRILSERRVAAVVFTRASMEERSPLFEELSRLARKPAVTLGTVLVDLDDPAEQRWIAEWKLDPRKIKRPLMIFVNPKGQALGQLEGTPTLDEMITLSKKRLHGCQDPNCTDPNCQHGR